MPQVDISSSNFARLQGIAVPLVDDINSVIGKCLDLFEAHNGTGLVPAGSTATPNSVGVQLFKPDTPPDLTHTKVLSAELNGMALGHSANYWNAILNAVIVAASAAIADPNQLNALIIVNHVVGKKEEHGYHYVHQVDLSVQGQDANSAWKAIFHIVKSVGLGLDVRFMWYANGKAAHPGAVGRLVYP